MNTSKRLVVLGAGESGAGAAILAQKVGYEVFVSDNGAIQVPIQQELAAHQIEFEMNGHSIDRILKADHVVKSPGIPDTVRVVQLLLEKGVPVISEIEFAFWYNRATIVAITGSNGKTTTTNLTHHLLKTGGVDALKGGNIGQSFARLVAEEEPEVFVLELSSFQLDGIRSFRPNLAVLLNITPDHLDRYDYKMENYIRSKFRINMNQTKTDLFIYNNDDEQIRQFLAGAVIQANQLPVSLSATSKEESLLNQIDNPALQGRHNRFNASCAIAIARHFQIEDKVILQALNSFTNDPHRLELVAEINGVRYINDSKATNVDAAFYALDAMQRPVIWIAGGTDKGNDYSPLDEMAGTKIKALICLGLDNQKLLEHFGQRIADIQEAQSAGEAVAKANKLAKSGDVVLLSPACASFDLFKNYMDRGEQFKKAVVAIDLNA